MANLVPQHILSTDAQYPDYLKDRLGAQAPTAILAIGTLPLLTEPLIAVFYSSRCPGEAILNAANMAG